MSTFVIARGPTPLLNTPDFEGVFGSEPLNLDHQGLLRPVEMVALPGTKFEVIQEVSPQVLEVTTCDYLGSPLFLDRRFVESSTREAPDREKLLPSKEEILDRLLSAVDLPYIWGGNWGEGIPEIISLYGGDDIPLRLLQGVDCSGLLYEATNGYTPRNTRELLSFGEEISHLSQIQPLDLIVWPGHVIIALDSKTSIESALGLGVFTAPLNTRLPSKPFVIRRFI